MNDTGRITILGAGFGALSTVRELRSRLCTAEITLVSPRAELHYLPGIIWIPSGQRTREDLVVPLPENFTAFTTQQGMSDVGVDAVPGKGVTGTRPWIEASKSKVRGGRLQIVGVDGIKAAIMGRLARGSSFRFSADLTPAWFEQLASERVIVRYNRGQPVRRFERIPGRRAEALDCVVYAVAVKQLLHSNWSVREEQLRHPETEQASERPRTIRSSWMENR